ncbi:probable G-protein coupled receptor Mth-like 3 isoform X2 [Hyposmocoma kahamanoa]|uniref:probable G-protein coupled receptor Mth-like 3 isoform X2 n=1 Tax=Hyposmocoma kahamanoa TaxID=1477025 RepID=UPI000E6D8A7D|nr:probable G-protein coupled receptor Mth-like 3 isoform X2 [Hyposmocoma kahamanoa]
MWKLSVLCFVISSLINLQSTVAEDQGGFRKCCAPSESLVKITDFSFECIDRESAKQTYNITNNDFSQIIISDNISINYGFPENCTWQMAQTNEVELTPMSDDASYSKCNDKIILEINGSQIETISKIVTLTCNIQNNSLTLEPEVTQVNVDILRKCCPSEEVYDSEYHVCRPTKEESTAEWLLSQLTLNSDSYIYNVETGLNCKSSEYSVELSVKHFSMQLEGSVLKVFKDHDIKVARGDWCVDRDYTGGNMIARVCTQNCAQYGAYCFRKCCPLGEHYQPFGCNTSRSKCRKSSSADVFLNMSIYFDPLEARDANLLDTQGIRTGLICEFQKFVINRTLPSEQHSLGTDGLLNGTPWDPHNYCVEMFDYRFCGAGVTVMTLACFIPEVTVYKNYALSAVSNTISAVFLALTLIVYLSLPELRNLHGRTVICHSVTMLLAYSCLARVQFIDVKDDTLCIFLGYGIYFGFVGAFVWLNVMCFDIWWTFGNIRSVQPLRKANVERKRFIWYSIYAWGATLLCTIVVYLFDKYPVSDLLKANMGKGICWFGTVQNSSTDWPHYIFFVIPMGILTSINLVLWGLTARHCARVKSEVHRMQAGSVGDRAKKRFRVDRAKYVLTGKLWIVMGAGWISELLSTMFSKPAWLWATVDLVNELQGLFIFLIFVCKPKVYHLIKKRLGLEKQDVQKNGTSSSGRTSSTFLSRTISNDERTVLRASLPNNDIKKA